MSGQKQDAEVINVLLERFDKQRLARPQGIKGRLGRKLVILFLIVHFPY